MTIRMISFILISFLLPFLLMGDERFPDIKVMISKDHLKCHVQNLHFDRNPYDHYVELEQAALYIQREFLKSGLEVQEDPFRWEGKRFKNIVAKKRGENPSDRVIILGAHYDTVQGSPGADDNASAVAVLLEVARNIQKVNSNTTIKFIAFTLEEYGFIGSRYYLEKVKREKESILGMISLEMVGFTGPKQNYPDYLNPKYYSNVGDFIGLIGNEGSKKLLEKVHRFFKTYIPSLPSEYLLVPRNGEGMEEVRLSDHSPFWDQGVCALMVTDTAFLRNPNYHLPSDMIETLDFEFMRKVAIGIYHSMIELAK